jgi:hypothetical protein
MRTLSLIFGILLFIAAILGGLYVGLWLCLVGGIVQIIEGAKATPISSMDIALGVLRFFCTALAGWGTFILGALISGIFIKASERPRRWGR